MTATAGSGPTWGDAANAVSALAALATGWITYLALSDQQQARRDQERGELFRHIVTGPLLTEMPVFLRASRSLLEAERASSLQGSGALMPDTIRLATRAIAKDYRHLLNQLEDPLQAGLTTWNDTSLSGRVQYQLDRLSDIPEQIPEMLEGKIDPKLPQQVTDISAVLSQIVLNHDYRTNPTAARRTRRLRFLRGG